MSTLQSYINDTRRLLHDALGRYWNDIDLTAYINSACKRAVADSTCYRQIQTIYLSTGLELYGYGMVSGCLVVNGGSGYVNPTVTFSAPPTGGTTAVGVVLSQNGVITDVQVTNGGSGYTSAPTATITGGPGTGAVVNTSVPNINTLDTINITVLWGNVRVILDRMSFTEFQSTVRAWVGYSQRPGLCASYGQNQWYINPLPDQMYVSEWDSVLIPPDLVNMTDVSVIQYPYTDPVPYYAAHLAKYQEQSYAEADKYLELYQQKMRYALRASMLRKLSSAYGS